MANINFLVEITELGKVSRYESFKSRSNPKYNIYERGLASIVYNFLIRNLQSMVLN